MNNRFANRLLALMAKSDLQMINSHLESVQLTTGTCLEYPSKQIEKVYFPESGVLSVVAVGGTRQTEIGLIGREGVSGLSVILAEDRSPHACYVQVSCKAYRLAARTLSTAMKDSLSLNESMIRYANYFLVQCSYTALANAQAGIEERLARRLLMLQDRPGDEVPLTHDQLAQLLGVRRAGITESLNYFERQALIRTGRGRIVIASRSGLKRIAGGLYGAAENKYLRAVQKSEATGRIT